MLSLRFYILNAKCNFQFTNATKLNDPFDCHPGLIDFSKMTLEQCKGWPKEDAIALKSNPYERNHHFYILNEEYRSAIMKAWNLN